MACSIITVPITVRKIDKLVANRPYVNNKAKIIVSGVHAKTFRIMTRNEICL